MRRPAWRRLGAEAVLTVAAALGVVCVVAALAAVVLDVRPLIFRSGSMSPSIPTGALALARATPADELRAGDVVSVTDGRGIRVTHRIEAIEPAGGAVALTLRGDANDDPDPAPYVVLEADRVFWSQPGLGTAVHRLQSPPVVFAAGAVAGSVLTLVVVAGRRRTAGDPEPPGPGDPDGRRGGDPDGRRDGDPPDERHSAAGRTGAGAGVAAVLALAALAVPAMLPADPTAAAFNDTEIAGKTTTTTSVAPVGSFQCQTTGTLVTTAVVQWAAPASGPTPTGYLVTITGNTAGAPVLQQQLLGASARSFAFGPSLLSLGRYRVYVTSVFGAWQAPQPTTPAYQLVDRLSLAGVGVSACV